MLRHLSVRKGILAATIAGTTALGAVGAGYAVLAPVHHAEAAESSYTQKLVLQNLNSFYKPALKGKFPGDMNAYTVGKTTRDEVLDRLGAAEVPRKNASGYDQYTANMGHPGYAFHYNKNNVLNEIRYFGTNVERQTNIGGITMKLLRQQWYAPASTTTIGSGANKQTKMTYIRGDYKLEFIFNSSTDLDHINLIKA
ncbi:YjgB family protein [Paenibacillus shenyangensis]|uniref:YjgB family protein n=1 Tax=Paenibacillus sp. A9 TaxID=1284352 RepID=UPI00037DEA90|nr:YjgB family protein [Paenibacillus sp. A9]